MENSKLVLKIIILIPLAWPSLILVGFSGLKKVSEFTTIDLKGLDKLSNENQMIIHAIKAEIDNSIGELDSDNSL